MLEPDGTYIEVYRVTQNIADRPIELFKVRADGLADVWVFHQSGEEYYSGLWRREGPNSPCVEPLPTEEQPIGASLAEDGGDTTYLCIE